MTLKKLFTILLSSFLLNACQTHLPIVSEHIGSADNKACVNNTQYTKSANIDYLLYANRMVDTMIKDDAIEQRVSSKRLKVLILEIKHIDNSVQIDMVSINNAVKNRLLRSGLFIVVNNIEAADVQLSGIFEKTKRQLTDCIQSVDQLSLQLTDSHSKQLIWSDKKQFK